MKTSQQQLLSILNVALATNNAAYIRSGSGCPVSKLNMLATKAELQNAILLLEAMIND